MSETGWFADLDDEDGEFPGMWRPYLQLPGMCLPLQIGFPTKEACLEFIRGDVLGQALHWTAEMED